MQQLDEGGRMISSGTSSSGTLPGLAVPALARWLRSNEPELVTAEPITARLIAGGRSNLTYSIGGAAEPIVLRRPPLGHVQSTAHDMAREFRVISALRATAVPVPRAIRLVDDPDAGVDAPFYLMQQVPGRILGSRADNAAYTPTQLRALSRELVETLAALHTMDAAEVGLADFGRPEGFLARQLERWGRQYDGSRSRDIPELDALQRELQDGIPGAGRSSIVHGDYRLDNALVIDVEGEPTISAILDWEMATLGDPLTDLGLFGLYWNLNGFDGVPPGVVATSVFAEDGYPSFEELVAVYSEAARVEVPELPWYLALAAFKLAVILEGIHFRHKAGQTVGEGFDAIGSLVTPIAMAGRRYLTEAN
jgi:aminoglycoside phosphotransferase (APT) family kinase protein